MVVLGSCLTEGFVGGSGISVPSKTVLFATSGSPYVNEITSGAKELTNVLIHGNSINYALYQANKEISGTESYVIFPGADVNVSRGLLPNGM